MEIMKVEAVIMMTLMAILKNVENKTSKVPRIYNALITSEEKLLPSQAYPAVSPVIHGTQYHFPGLFTNFQTFTGIPSSSIVVSDEYALGYSTLQESYPFYYGYRNNIGYVKSGPGNTNLGNYYYDIPQPLTYPQNSYASNAQLQIKGYEYPRPEFRAQELPSIQNSDKKEEESRETEFIKNNGPKNPDIVDVPPDPLPSLKSNKEEKESKDYPPPPIGFI